VLPVEGTPLDYREPKQIGAAKLNHCLTGVTRDAQGIATATFFRPGLGHEISLWFDKGFHFLVVYSGDAIEAPEARKRLAIEPMTCGSDGFNHPEWGTVGLEAGGERHGTFGIRPTKRP
jgi:aldose 1-epimerase